MDLDRSTAWYCDVFNLAPVSTEENIGPPYFTDVRYRGLFDMTTFTYVIALHQHPEPVEGAFDARRLGLDHIGFNVPEREDLDDWVQRLDERRVAHSGIVDAPYGTAVSFKDPDGIALELLRPKPDFWGKLISQHS